MQKLIHALFNSGIGTIIGHYRLSPATLKMIEDNSRTSLFERSKKKIPDWFACALCDKNFVSLGTIDKDINVLVIGKEKLRATYFEISKNKKEWYPKSIKIDFTKNGKYDTDSTLEMYFDLKEETDELQYVTHEHFMRFRITMSPGLWWNNKN